MAKKKILMEKFSVDCSNVLTTGIDIIKFYVHVITKFVYLSLDTFLYYIWYWTLNNEVLVVVIFFRNSELIF